MNKIAIGVPARDMVHTVFAFDLTNAVATHVATTDDIVVPLVSTGTMLPSHRTELVVLARREGATHLLFIDSDMSFPKDVIARLLAAGELVVAANCARRRMPTGPTAANYDEKGVKSNVYTMADSVGLEKVDAVGTGIMLVDMRVFDMAPAPWFACPWVIDQNGFMGEDIFFCRLLKKYDIPIHIDHDVSLEIGHVGTWEYKHSHTWAIKEADEAKAVA